MKLKLSDRQVELLKRFGAGGILIRSGWPNDYEYQWRVVKGGTVNNCILEGLNELGLIGCEWSRYAAATKYAITDKGREYLAGLRTTPDYPEGHSDWRVPNTVSLLGENEERQP